MRKLLGVCIVLTLALVSCTEIRQEVCVEENKEIEALRSEIEKLKAEVETAKNVGRYQMRDQGRRTWRFDTVTGRTCLLLAPEEDWKKGEVSAESCAYDDAHQYLEDLKKKTATRPR